LDDMPLNSPKRPPYWNSTSGFDFDHHRSWHVILHQSAKFYTNRTTLGRKMTSFAQNSIFRVQQWVLWKAHVRLPIGRQ